ncbi:MAG: IS66 family transposase [Halieaceae bacterium]|jgi:transposase|nr:IS66 family transposase [Halieaceae bacterium]
MPRNTDQLLATIDSLEAVLASKDNQIEHLKLVIAKLQRQQFGRRAEAHPVPPNQFSLGLDGKERAAPIKLPLTSEPKPERERPSRKPLPAHLPRDIHVHAVDDAAGCPDCGGDLRRIGEDVSEMLEYIPARFRVTRHVRSKLACACCNTLVQAEAPERPICRGMAGPGLLAHVLVSKYCDHLPLYRQSQIYAREGVDIPGSTLSDWIRQSSHLLAPLVEALRRHTMAGNTVHADDTPVPVLAPGNGRTRTGRFWTYVRDERPAGSDAPPAVWFAYSPDRQGIHPQSHLADFRGTIHADGYAGFNRLFDGTRQEAACWAHVRRKFYEIQQAQDSPLASTALDYIQTLYRVEEQIRGKPPDDRRQARQARAGPVLTGLKQWLDATLTRVSKKSELAKAIRYALGRWQALLRYRDDGGLEIDNNAAERALRGVALGRKNYLFVGSDRGGEWAAAVYSLVGTAKLNGIDPQAYLTHVLDRIGSHAINRVDELLPWHVADQLTSGDKETAATDQRAA